MAKADLTAQRLRELLHYDEESGVFTRIAGRFSGKVAGSITNGRYIHIYVFDKSYQAHRLAWLYVTGAWPANDIDHLDGDGLNNRWNNLRDVTESINLQNQRRARSDNQSGLMGALKRGTRWRSMINIAGKQVYLGTFRTPELAHAAYLAAKRAHHPGNTL